MELEENGALPFLSLDILIQRDKEKAINIGVYRKPSNTDCYLQYISHHPNHVKQGPMVSALYHGVRAIAHGANRNREEEHLIQLQVLQDNECMSM